MRKLLLTTLLSLGTSALMAQVLPYQNPQLSAEQRADDLLGRLTLEEKTKLMMDVSPAIPRLGIPQFQWWNEALHGIGRNGFVTVFPITTQMAATWNDQLVHQIFTAVSDEARDKNQEAKKTGKISRYQGLSFWTPNINIFRDPRWGRGQETYGEDPYLTERMGLAVVNGLQGQDMNGNPVAYKSADGQSVNTKYRKLLACAKHFAVHSGPEWNRHVFDIQQLPERDLWETYLPAFKALVQKGHVAEVMCAYQRIDGDPCCGNARYEQHILRDEWGFKGLITSDCGAIRDFLPKWHNVSKDDEAAASKAVLSGTDVECGSVYRSLPAAVKRGDISEKQMDVSLKRLLVARFELGDFDKDELVEWTKIPSSVIASKEHKQLALQAAREGIVLLTNNGVLPLDAKSANGKIVVMGPNANDSIMQWGNYSGFATKTVTVLEGLRRLLGNVPYVQGCGLTRNEVYESRFDKMLAPEGGMGMRAYYWNNTEMKGEPVATQLLRSAINLSNGGNTVFAPGVNLENFSARYVGTLVPTTDEALTLRVGADDKVRVIVNGDTVVDIWKVRQRIQEAAPVIKAKKGNTYRIQIDYVQETGMAAMQFDVCKQLNPTSQQLLAQIKGAETVVFVGGISPRVEGEEMKVSDPGFKGGDRTDIELPAVQRQLLKALHDAGKKVVFVNCSGGAMAMVPELESCDAILQAWYSGELGGQAIAEVITGQQNPCGKLPMTFYKSVNDLPDFLDYTMKNRTYRYFRGETLFPFGYGLSYTTFERGKPVYKNNKVTLTLKNTGKMDGTEVVQVYVRNTADKEGPLKTLRAYERVSLKAGESRQVSIDFPRDRFEGWDVKTNTMRVVPGKYELMVGTSSADGDLSKIVVNVK
ncbi:MAG: glycoside hydrolase family 3 C-terminal domain-containing protein [Prevotella sp.]|nr:glycoside hydrolase family 3 C-terminal domain-containing protein [Prevotella sp.]